METGLNSLWSAEDPPVRESVQRSCYDLLASIVGPPGAMPEDEVAAFASTRFPLVTFVQRLGSIYLESGDDEVYPWFQVVVGYSPAARHAWVVQYRDGYGCQNGVGPVGSQVPGRPAGTERVNRFLLRLLTAITEGGYQHVLPI